MDGEITSDRLIERIDELERQVAEKAELERKLAAAREASHRRERELFALMGGAKSVLENRGFPDTARAIFDYCKELIGATSGYVALLNENGDENEILFLEAGGLPCDVDPELPMPIRGLRAEAYSENRAVFHNDFMNSEWTRYLPAGHVILRNVLFAPLVLDRKTVGIIGLANKEKDFDHNDALIATGFGEIAAIALQNSRHVDRRKRAEDARERMIVELRASLRKVKRLSGLLPICSICKQIRDDKGYWKQIEEYIEDHSEAEMSHSICPGCAKIYYPDLDIYGT